MRPGFMERPVMGHVLKSRLIGYLITCCITSGLLHLFGRDFTVEGM